MRAGEIWAVVPVKDFASAKQRLSDVLCADERAALYAAMLADVLDALAGCAALGGIMMVTRDPDASALAKRYGAEVLREDENRGHSAASSLGASELAHRGASGMLQVPGDLPLLCTEDVAAILNAHGPAPSVTIAPSGDLRGSNAIASSPPDFLPLQFGDDSFYPHRRAAEALGAVPKIVTRPGFQLDIDTPEDLAALLSRPRETRALAYLRDSGVAAKLRRHFSDEV